MSEREDYLDGLLRSMEGNPAGSESQETEEEFLDNYDSGLSGIDEDEFLKDFEKSLGKDIDSEVESAFEDEGFFSQEDDLDNPDQFMDDIGSIVSDVKSGQTDELDPFDDGDLSIEESLKDFEGEDTDLDQIGNEFASEDTDFMVNTLDGEGILEPVGQTGQEFRSEEEGLPEGDMDAAARELAAEIEGLNLEVEEDPKRKGKKEQEPKPEEQKEKKQKKGFFARLSAILFGEEEEEQEQESQQAAEAIPEMTEIENISDENLEILRELEGKKEASAEEAKKEKEQKEKEQKEQKEQKKKEKAEKKAQREKAKKERAEKRAQKAKEKKEKEPETVEKTKPLPKGPAILMILLGLSVVVLVTLLSDLAGYNAALSDAEAYYARGKYVEAYGCLSKDTVKKADQEFYDRVRLDAYVQQQINMYKVYQKQGEYTEALGALICGVGRYDRYVQEASQAGAEYEYEDMLKYIQKALKKKYNMKLDQARKFYELDDKQEFTYAVDHVIEELGL